MALCLHVCVCVCMSVISQSSVETTGRIELFSARRLSSAYFTLCIEEIRLSPKIKELPDGTLTRTLDLEYFATARRSSQVCVANLVRQRWTFSVIYWRLSSVELLHTHPFNGPFSGTTRVSQYQKGKTNLDFTEARDSEWQWHQLGHMQVCTLFQTDNHSSTPPLELLS